jgi:hypothetical protein
MIFRTIIGFINTKNVYKSHQYEYQPEFEYHAIGGGASLEDIKIKCKNCNKTRSMSGALNNSYHKFFKCNGYRPELHNKTPFYEKCSVDNLDVRFVLRNASNVYFPNIFSSLLIPPFSRELSMRLQSLASFKYLRQKYIEDPGSQLYNNVFTDCIQEASRLFAVPGEKIKYLIDELLTLNVKSRNIDDYKMSEFNALLEPSSSDENFKVENSNVYKLNKFKIEKLIRCDRLREARVFSGYTRIKPIDKNIMDSNEIDEDKYKGSIYIAC